MYNQHHCPPIRAVCFVCSGCSLVGIFDESLQVRFQRDWLGRICLWIRVRTVLAYQTNGCCSYYVVRISPRLPCSPPGPERCQTEHRVLHRHRTGLSKTYQTVQLREMSRKERSVYRARGAPAINENETLTSPLQGLILGFLSIFAIRISRSDSQMWLPRLLMFYKYISK